MKLYANFDVKTYVSFVLRMYSLEIYKYLIVPLSYRNKSRFIIKLTFQELKLYTYRLYLSPTILWK